MLISKQEEEAEDEASRRRQEAEDEGRTTEAAKGGRHQHMAILRRQVSGKPDILVNTRSNIRGKIASRRTRATALPTTPVQPAVCRRTRATTPIQVAPETQSS